MGALPGIGERQTPPTISGLALPGSRDRRGTSSRSQGMSRQPGTEQPPAPVIADGGERVGFSGPCPTGGGVGSKRALNPLRDKHGVCVGGIMNQ